MELEDSCLNYYFQFAEIVFLVCIIGLTNISKYCLKINAEIST